MQSNSRRHQRREQMFTLIRHYLSSGLTQRQFCDTESVPYSTFCWWLRKYRNTPAETDKRERTPSKFIPIHLASTDSPIGSTHHCVIEYPNGVTLRLAGELDAALLAGLIALPLS